MYVQVYTQWWIDMRQDTHTVPDISSEMSPEEGTTNHYGWTNTDKHHNTINTSYMYMYMYIV